MRLRRVLRNIKTLCTQLILEPKGLNKAIDLVSTSATEDSTNKLKEALSKREVAYNKGLRYYLKEVLVVG